MLSRAFTKPRRSPRDGETSLRSTSILHEYEDFIFGFMEDIPVISFHESENNHNKTHNKNCDCTSESQMTLRLVLRASVGVMGESRRGITEKVVLLGGNICALKRFRKVSVRKSEFGRRIEKLAQAGNQCEFLVPINAYLFAKRIKFVLCDYYPMGSLADLLYGMLILTLCVFVTAEASFVKKSLKLTKIFYMSPKIIVNFSLMGTMKPRQQLYNFDFELLLSLV